MTGVPKTQLRGCMTVHNLIDSSYHPVLNDLFELALRGDSDAKTSPFMSSSSDNSKSCGLASTSPPVAIAASIERATMSIDVARERQIATAMAPPSSISLDRSISPRSDSDFSDGSDAMITMSDTDVIERNSTKEKRATCTCTPTYKTREEERANDEIYVSLTLPCVSLPRSSVPLLMTIVLMNDIDPSKRCFYCIMSPTDQGLQPTAPTTCTCDAHDFHIAFVLAQQQQQQQRGSVDADQSMLVSFPGDASKAFLIALQSSTVGIIRWISQHELTNLL